MATYRRLTALPFSIGTIILSRLPNVVYGLSVSETGGSVTEISKSGGKGDEPESASGKGEGGEGGDKGGGDDFDGDTLGNLVQSWAWATFGISIFAEFFSFIIFIISVKSLSRHQRFKRSVRGSSTADIWNTGTAFCCFCVLGSFFLAAYYPLFLLQIVLPKVFEVSSISQSQLPSGMMFMTSDLADITIACAFLSLVHHRQDLHFPKTISAWKVSLDVILIMVMIVFTAVKTTLISNISTYESQTKYNTLNIIFHIYVALFVLVTVDITISATLLWGKISSIPNKDDQLIYHLCYRICLFIVPQAIFRLCYEVIVSLPPNKTKNINFDALMFADTLIKGVAYTFALLYGLRHFFPGQALISCQH